MIGKSAIRTAKGIQLSQLVFLPYFHKYFKVSRKQKQTVNTNKWPGIEYSPNTSLLKHLFNLKNDSRSQI